MAITAVVHEVRTGKYAENPASKPGLDGIEQDSEVCGSASARPVILRPGISEHDPRPVMPGSSNSSYSGRCGRHRRGSDLKCDLCEHTRGA